LSSADTTVDVEAPIVDDARDSIAAAFTEALGDGMVETFVKPACDVVLRVRADAWLQAADAARNGLGFRFFDFLSAIDWMPSPFGRDMDAEQDAAGDTPTDVTPEPITPGYGGGDTRFQVLARVYSLYEHLGVTLKADVPDDDPRIESWVSVYGGVNWHEREAHEMFGIEFVGHPGLRHLYLPGDFEGHPLRKDFPLVARRVKPWPGIVDVEGMPGDDEAADGDDTPTDESIA
jgi:NADH-quinone oxidoreductase subunit C